MKSEGAAQLAQTKLLPHLEEIEDSRPLTLSEKISHLKQKPWTRGQYKKENWGNHLHSVAPYIARIKPAFAHWLIRIFTRRGDVVLDPFCGIGTVPLEADLLGRTPIGIDLHPYAVAVAKAKFDRRPLEENVRWLQDVSLKVDEVDVDSVPAFVKKYYHEKTLREILALRKEILTDERDLLLGCLLGISHGHRPQYLSAWTGYIIPFEPKTKAEYRPVIPRMIAKVKRMCKDGVPLETRGVIHRADARKLPIPNGTVDTIITSPPYFDTIDYVGANRVRLAIIGQTGDDIDKLKKTLIQKEDSYLDEMKKVGKELLRVMKNGSTCVFVLGDCQKGIRFRNTAEEVGSLYKTLGFELIDTIEDEIPLARRTALKWGGKKGLQRHNKKLDRILVMRK